MGSVFSRNLSNTSDNKSDSSEDSYFTCLEALTSEPEPTDPFTPVATSRLRHNLFYLHMKNPHIPEDSTPSTPKARVYRPKIPWNMNDTDPFVYSYPVKPVLNLNASLYWSLYPNTRPKNLLSGHQYTNLLEMASIEGKGATHFFPPVSKYVNPTLSTTELHALLFYDMAKLLCPIPRLGLSPVGDFSKLNQTIPEVDELHYRDLDIQSIVYTEDNKESSPTCTDNNVISKNKPVKKRAKRGRIRFQLKRAKPKKKLVVLPLHPSVTPIQVKPPGNFLKGTRAEYIYEYDEYDFKPKSFLSKRMSYEYPILCEYKDLSLNDSVSSRAIPCFQPPIVRYRTFDSKHLPVLSEQLKDKFSTHLRNLIDHVNTSIFDDMFRLLLPKLKLSKQTRKTLQTNTSDMSQNITPFSNPPGQSALTQLPIAHIALAPDTPTSPPNPNLSPHSTAANTTSLVKSCLRAKRDGTRLVDPLKIVRFNIGSNSIHYYPEEDDSDLVNVVIPAKPEKEEEESAKLSKIEWIDGVSHVKIKTSIDVLGDEKVNSLPDAETCEIKIKRLEEPIEDLSELPTTLESFHVKREINKISTEISLEPVVISEYKKPNLIPTAPEFKFESIYNSESSTEASYSSATSKSSSIDTSSDRPIPLHERSTLDRLYYYSTRYSMKRTSDEEMPPPAKGNLSNEEADASRPRRSSSGLYKRIIDEVIKLNAYREYQESLKPRPPKKRSGKAKKSKSKRSKNDSKRDENQKNSDVDDKDYQPPKERTKSSEST